MTPFLFLFYFENPTYNPKPHPTPTRTLTPTPTPAQPQPCLSNPKTQTSPPSLPAPTISFLIFFKSFSCSGSFKSKSQQKPRDIQGPMVVIAVYNPLSAGLRSTNANERYIINAHISLCNLYALLYCINFASSETLTQSAQQGMEGMPYSTLLYQSYTRPHHLPHHIGS